MKTGASLLPSGRNQDTVHLRSFNAVEEGGFVMLVDMAHGDKNGAGPDIEIFLDQKIEVGVLEFRFLKCVLEIEFGAEFQPVVEIVSETENKPVKINLVSGRADAAVIVEFTVAEDMELAEGAEPFEPLLVGFFFKFFLRNLDFRSRFRFGRFGLGFRRRQIDYRHTDKHENNSRDP